MEDIILLVMASKHDRREVEFGPNPEKPVFPVDAVKQYESKEVDTGLYRITASSLGPGEYLFLLLGSGDEKKGLLGKGWEFDPIGEPKSPGQVRK